MEQSASPRVRATLEAVAQHMEFLWMTTLPTPRSDMRMTGPQECVVQQPTARKE